MWFWRLYRRHWVQAPSEAIQKLPYSICWNHHWRQSHLNFVIGLDSCFLLLWWTIQSFIPIFWGWWVRAFDSSWRSRSSTRALKRTCLACSCSDLRNKAEWGFHWLYTNSPNHVTTHTTSTQSLLTESKRKSGWERRLGVVWRLQEGDSRSGGLVYSTSQPRDHLYNHRRTDECSQVCIQFIRVGCICVHDVRQLAIGNWSLTDHFMEWYLSSLSKQRLVHLQFCYFSFWFLSNELDSLCFICEDNTSPSGTVQMQHCCPLCPTLSLTVKPAAKLIYHMATHILFDPVVWACRSPCGFCCGASDTGLCTIYLIKSKGRNGVHIIDLDQSRCKNGNVVKLSLASWQESTECTNSPLLRPLCPSGTPAVWKYNLLWHIQEVHPTANPEAQEYKSLYKIEQVEHQALKKSQLTKTWVTPNKLGKLGELKISSSHSAQLAVRLVVNFPLINLFYLTFRQHPTSPDQHQYFWHRRQWWWFIIRACSEASAN